MIELYSTNLTSTAGMAVTWGGKSIQTSNSATLNSDGQTISLNTGGVYEVTVNGFGTTTADGAFGFQLYGAGNAIVRANSQTATTAGDAGTASFTTLVKVTPAYSPTARATIVLNYTGDAGTINLVNIVVKRVR